MTDRDPRDTAHPTMPPNYPGAQDECATCGHRRWRHKAVDGQQVCTEYVNCACGGHFVELSYGTRMARFVEAAQKVARSISTVRDALQDTMRATTELYAAMQLAGLLPEEEPASAAGKHAADRDAAVATIAEAFDIPAEMLTGPSPDGLPDHWTGAAPLRQPTDWHAVGCDKRCGGTCMGLIADPHPVGSGSTDDHRPGEADPEATQTIPAVESPEPSGKQPARLWSWDAGTGGWVQIDSGPAEAMIEGRDRRYRTAASNDMPGCAWAVRAPGDAPDGPPDRIGVPTT